MDYSIDSTTERLSSTGGIALAGKIFERIQLGTDEVGKTLKHPQLLRVLAGLFVQGRTRYEEVELFRSDALFQRSLELPYVPAPETLRLYLEQMLDQQKTVQQAVEAANLRLLRRTRLTPVLGERGKYLPLDIDTTVLDNSKSHKEGVSRTYKQVDGYHPILSYLGQEGYLLSCELREGKQHCQNGTPTYLEHTLALAEKLRGEIPLLVRMDAGHDAQETLRVLHDSGHYFVVKRNPRKGNPAQWLSVAQVEGRGVQEDARKTVYRGSYTQPYPGSTGESSTVRVVYEVTVVHQDEEGTTLLFPEITVQSFWTNLAESAEEVIRLYHQHGTSEQFHSELKSDLHIERLPSGKFGVNAMILRVAMVAFNTLRYLGQRSLELEVPYTPLGFRKRLRKVMDDLVRVAVKVVQHGRTVYLKLWAKDPWLPCFRQLYYLCCNL